jgi:hypothetical protein
MVYRKPAETEAVSAEELGLGREIVSLTVDGAKHELDGGRRVIGRVEGLRHPARRPERLAQARRGAAGGRAYWVVDLGSTNGMEVNGRRQKRAKLRQGDRITLGSTELVFRRETESD